MTPTTKLHKQVARPPAAGARRRPTLLLLVALVASCALAACDRKAPRSQNTRPPKSDLERKLDTARSNQYVRIYVIRRPDGQPLKPEDRQYLRDIKEMSTSMWLLTEDGATAIASAGFEFEPKTLEDLSKRFTVEDYTGK
ncbi:MAG: hypothetical protein LC800_01265, partial [Acidobacteria bacterium]|nr:hypothetical protein [Acidobacteriota bacterium]